MKNNKSNFANKEKDIMKRKQREKRIAMTLAAGMIVGVLPSNFTYAETNVIEKLNSELGVKINGNTIDTRTGKEITLNNGKKIRAFKDSNNNIILQEENNGNWVDKHDMGQINVKEMEATNDGGYTVTYLDANPDNYLKFKQAFGEDSTKKGDEEIVGVDVPTDISSTLKIDLEVDKANNKTTIKTGLEEVTVEDFVVVAGFDGFSNIIISGKDLVNDPGYETFVVVTDNGKIISGDVIKGLDQALANYSEVEIRGVAIEADKTFIASGSAVKASEPGKKDGFLIEFDGNGNKASNVKIIPSSYSKTGDATIRTVMKFDTGNIYISGPNLDPMWINSLNYVDNRPVKESLTLASGKSYKVVQETNTSRAGENDTKTFTVKSVSELMEYDIATYKDVKGIELIPGNNNQVIIAVSNTDNSTEVGVINTDNDAEIDNDGIITSKVVNAGKIEDSNGPILNIDIENIKINADGKLTLTTNNNSTTIEVSVNSVEAGTPIDVEEEEKPEEKPEVTPPVEEEKPEEKPEVTPPVEEEKPEEKPEVTPPVENNQIVNADKGEEIVFDITKPSNVTIVSSKLENKDIDYILVNGIKVTRTTIERKLARSISEKSTGDYFTVSNGSITLAAKLFEDLNLDPKEGYNIGVGFVDGSEITNLVKLNVVDSSIDNTVKPPVGNNGNNSNNGNTSNGGSNSTTNKVEETNKTEVNKLPNTGAPISSGIVAAFGMVSAFVGTRLLKKKK